MTNPSKSGKEKKKLLVFHPIIAPYRIDFFNDLTEHFDARICLTWRNLHDQTFDYAKIEEQFHFKPYYLGHQMIKVIPTGIISNIRQFKPDIILVPECGIVSLIVLAFRALTRAHYKVVSIIDDSYDMICGNHFTKKHALAERLLIPHFDNIINVDNRATSHFQKKYNKGIFVPIVSDENKMRAKYGQILSISENYIQKYNLEDTKIVLFVGRMVKLKNIDTLIRAFRRLTSSNYRLILVGNGEDYSRLVAVASGDDRIIFTGRFEGNELYAWYNIAHIFCLPSFTEPFGAVTSEALMGGCKCIISDRAGSQCLLHNDNGAVFNPYDETQLHHLLAEYLESLHPIKMPLSLRENLNRFQFRKIMNRLIDDII